MSTSENIFELKKRLSELLQLQRVNAFIVTGVYLTKAQIQCIYSELQPDEPSIGAIGRYHRVPVYDCSETPIPNEKDNDSCGDISFTYVRVDNVD